MHSYRIDGKRVALVGASWFVFGWSVGWHVGQHPLIQAAMGIVLLYLASQKRIGPERAKPIHWFWLHEWDAVEVQHILYTEANSPADTALMQEKNLGIRQTRVLYRCPLCWRSKVTVLVGVWPLERFRTDVASKGERYGTGTADQAGGS